MIPLASQTTAFGESEISNPKRSLMRSTWWRFTNACLGAAVGIFGGGGGKGGGTEGVAGCGLALGRGAERGSGGDDELISVDLERVPREIQRLAVTVTIHSEPGGRSNRFADLRSAYVRVSNEETRSEILRFQLDSSFGQETALIFSELYRHQDGWKFRAVGQGFVGGLRALCGHFGVVVDD